MFPYVCYPTLLSNPFVNQFIIKALTRNKVGVYDKIRLSYDQYYERSDIIHIMKMNRFTLIGSDTAQLTFSRCFQEKDYTIGILVMENEPQVKVKQNESVIVSETFKSIDDLKIFLEERFYQYLG